MQRVHANRKGIDKLLAASSSGETKTQIELWCPNKHGYRDAMIAICRDASVLRKAEAFAVHASSLWALVTELDPDLL